MIGADRTKSVTVQMCGAIFIAYVGMPVFTGCHRNDATREDVPDVAVKEEPVPEPQPQKVAAEIRAQIPAATAMSLQDMLELTELRKEASKAGAIVSPRQIERACSNKPLTLILYTLRPEDDDASKRQFEVLTGYFGASRSMGEELQRTAKLGATDESPGTMTLVADERITDVTCDIDGDTATGIVSFEMPEVYRGAADYVAHNVDDAWQIDEFHLPAYGVHLVRNEDGTWKKRTEK